MIFEIKSKEYSRALKIEIKEFIEFIEFVELRVPQ